MTIDFVFSFMDSDNAFLCRFHDVFFWFFHGRNDISHNLQICGIPDPSSRNLVYENLLQDVEMYCLQDVAVAPPAAFQDDPHTIEVCCDIPSINRPRRYPSYRSLHPKVQPTKESFKANWTAKIPTRDLFAVAFLGFYDELFTPSNRCYLYIYQNEDQRISLDTNLILKEPLQNFPCAALEQWMQAEITQDPHRQKWENEAQDWLEAYLRTHITPENLFVRPKLCSYIKDHFESREPNPPWEFLVTPRRIFPVH